MKQLNSDRPDVLGTLVKDAEVALADAESQKQALVQRHKEEIEAMNTEVAERHERMVQLRARARRAGRKTPLRSDAVQAGPKAMSEVADALRGGPLSQAEITKVTGLNEGTVSYAIRAWIAEGVIELTGQKIGKSRELRLVNRSSTVSRELYEQARKITQRVRGTAKTRA